MKLREVRELPQERYCCWSQAAAVYYVGSDAW